MTETAPNLTDVRLVQRDDSFFARVLCVRKSDRFDLSVTAEFHKCSHSSQPSPCAQERHRVAAGLNKTSAMNVVSS